MSIHFKQSNVSTFSNRVTFQLLVTMLTSIKDLIVPSDTVIVLFCMSYKSTQYIYKLRLNTFLFTFQPNKTRINKAVFLQICSN